MTFDVPDDRRYTESHEWAHADGDTVRVGITDFAQDELGDIVFVELPEVGDELGPDEVFGIVESIKAVSDLHTPIRGTVTAVNEGLFDAPELVNDDPFGDGWMLELEPTDGGAVEGLLSPADYRGQIG
jgi:glycine cleavage system H protein